MPPQIIERLQHPRELIMQRTRPACDFLGVATLPLIAPDALHRAQRREQRGRTDHDDIAVVGTAEQGRLLLERGDERRLDRHEHQHEIERAQALEVLVVLDAECLDVISQCAHMRPERRAAQVLVGCRAVALVIAQRHLGIDHHVAALRQAHDHVRYAPLTLGIADCHLGIVLAALVQPRLLEHPLEDHLAPTSLHLAVAFQGAGEVQRLVTHLTVQLLQRADLVQQFDPPLAIPGVDLVDATAELRELFAQRRQRQIERGLALACEAVCLFLENAVGQRSELDRKLRPRLLEQVHLLGRGTLLFLLARAQRGVFILFAGKALLQLIDSRLATPQFTLEPLDACGIQFLAHVASHRLRGRHLLHHLEFPAARPRGTAPRKHAQHQRQHTCKQRTDNRGRQQISESGQIGHNGQPGQGGARSIEDRCAAMAPFSPCGASPADAGPRCERGMRRGADPRKNVRASR